VKYSEEIRLIIKNWEIIENLNEKVVELGKLCTKELYSINEILSHKRWWRNGWIFIEQDQGEIYIAKKEYRIREEDSIWIGIENFDPDHIFGNQDPPNLYLYLPGNRPSLHKGIMNILFTKESKVIGEVVEKGNTYLLKENVKKYLGERIETYMKEVKEQVIKFLEYYALQINESGKEIRKIIIKK
jgi:hypothetical protein